MKTILKNNISTLFITYILILIVLDVLPINSKDSALNNNYILNLRLDYLGHFLAYGILGMLGFLYAKSKQSSLWLAVTFLLAFAISSEFFQKLIFWRSFNINDLAANTIGVILGVMSIFILSTANRKLKVI